MAFASEASGGAYGGHRAGYDWAETSTPSQIPFHPGRNHKDFWRAYFIQNSDAHPCSMSESLPFRLNNIPLHQAFFIHSSTCFEHLLRSVPLRFGCKHGCTHIFWLSACFQFVALNISKWHSRSYGNSMFNFEEPPVKLFYRGYTHFGACQVVHC